MDVEDFHLEAQVLYGPCRVLTLKRWQKHARRVYKKQDIGFHDPFRGWGSGNRDLWVVVRSCMREKMHGCHRTRYEKL